METIRIRLSGEELAVLNEIAKRSERSITKVIRDWINSVDSQSYNVKDLFK